MFFLVIIKIYIGIVKIIFIGFIVSISVIRSINWMFILDFFFNELVIWLKILILIGTIRIDDYDNGDDVLFLFFIGFEFVIGII